MNEAIINCMKEFDDLVEGCLVDCIDKGRLIHI